VTVRLHGGIQGKAAGSNHQTLHLPSGSTLLSVQDALGIPRGEVGLFVVDGELRNGDYEPEDGAIVDIYPFFGGG
jgi:hypothetical protein